MGRNSIERGSTDTWTVTPKRVAALEAAIPQDSARPQGGDAGGGGGGRPTTTSPADFATYTRIMRSATDRDPRGYIIPADQPDFLTATKFVNALIKTGIQVQRATSAFTVDGKSYPAGSLVVKTNQAFRPHILDMFEPQDHPNDIPYPGGAPIPPYDNAGWTLAYQMGVKFDRVLDDFSGPFARVTGFAKPAVPHVGPAAAGYVFSHSENDAFVAVNRLLAHGDTVYTLINPLNINGRTYDVTSTDVRTESSSRGQRSGEVIGGTAVLGAIIGGIAGGGKGAAIGAASGAAVGTGAEVLTNGQRVRIPSETRLSFRLQTPLQL
jgi:hypothetical protein